MKLRPANVIRHTFSTPTFVARGANNSGSGIVTYALPTGWAAGDIHLLVYECSNADTPAAVAGWTHVTGSPVVGTTTQLVVMWRRAEAGDADQAVGDPGDHQVGYILGFRGCRSSGNPWDAVGSGTLAATTTPSIPSITTVNPKSLIVAILAEGADDGGSQFSGWANSNLTDVTERGDNATISNDGGGVGAVTGIAGASGSVGAIGATSVTMVNSTDSAYLVLALSAYPA